MNKLFTLILISLFFLIRPGNVNAQLVPNGGFESYMVCPVGFSEFAGKVSNWLNPNTASPDYMNACANPFPAGVPKNGIGFQEAHGGQAYAGTYTFSGTIYREFIQVQLSTPLIAGHSYLFEMYTVLHNNSETAIDDIGAYFSITNPTAAGTGMLTGSPDPQISNPLGAVITDTLNWTLISGTYIATGGEKYVTIGHLKDDAFTTYLDLPYGSVGAYYYFDDVSLIDLTILPVTITSFSGKLVNEGTTPFIQLKWLTANELNNCCFTVEKSINGTHYSEIGNLQGAGTSSSQQEYAYTDQTPSTGLNYYRLKQIDFDGTSEYSSTIFVNNIYSENLTDIWTAGKTIYIRNNCEDEHRVAAYSLTGQLISSINVNKGLSEWKLNLENNEMIILYINNMNNEGAPFVKKLIIN